MKRSRVEPLTARQPDATGVAEHDGVHLAWARYGEGPITLLLMPTWQIVDSRIWKFQVGYLARHFRVITYDGRGSGDSDRPLGADAYTNDVCAEDAIAVLDATGTEEAVLVALSCGATWSVIAAAEHPERVSGIVAVSPSCGLQVAQPQRAQSVFEERLATTEGWAKYNRHYWIEGDFTDFRYFFFDQMFSEPHSTKQREDGLSWSDDTDPRILAEANSGRMRFAGVRGETFEAACEQVSCPVLVIHGTDDRVSPDIVGRRLAELTDAQLVLVEGGGHGILLRDPVRTNTLIHDFARSLHPPTAKPPAVTWTHAAARPRRVLYLSSPIGLGHARRDLAIAEELRLLHPDLQIDWLAQHPVTRVLQDHGERVHPASGWLASESRVFEHESDEHDLNAFQAIRRMDSTLVNNFMVFRDLVDQESYDLVIADEAWDVDHLLHENPELKRFAFAWMTDFVGWLPMPAGGEEEAALTADYNAEMIEQRARFARVRDRSVFVGSPEDVVPASFGPGLPEIRDWMADNFDFAGYVSGFDAAALPERDELRSRLGMREGRRTCIVTVGGTGVGRALLERVLDAVPLVRRQAPEMEFVVVTGPRIDPASLPRRRGTRMRGYLPDLHEHLIAADLAVVQGGLTTCMELTAGGRPFVYVPLRNHFEQNYHVRHRLDRYGAGRCVAYEQAMDPDLLAQQILAEADREVDYRPVEGDGAARAARLLGELV